MYSYQYIVYANNDTLTHADLDNAKQVGVSTSVHIIFICHNEYV